MHFKTAFEKNRTLPILLEEKTIMGKTRMNGYSNEKIAKKYIETKFSAPAPDH